MAIIVSSGVTSSYRHVSGSSMCVQPGGLINSTWVYSNGTIIVSSGASAWNTFVSSGGTMHIYGSKVSDVRMDAGVLFVYSGGSVNPTEVGPHASMNVYSGGEAQNTVISCSDGYRGKVTVANGGLVKYTSVYGGILNVSSGGMANITNIINGVLIVSNGGTANSTTVNVSGFLTVSGKASNTIVNSGGSVDVFSGAVADYLTLSSSKSVRGAATVHNGGLANHVSLLGGNLQVSSGGTVNSTTVDAGGDLIVLDGGTANSTTVDAGGNLIVLDGGTANSTTVNTSGKLYLRGTASNTIVNSLGSLHVSSGGKAKTTTVSAGGRMNVVSGAVAEYVTIHSSGASRGVVTISGGGSVSRATLSGGQLYVNSSAVASRTIVNGGKFEIGGQANSTTVNAGGSFSIWSGGTADNTTVNSNGCFTLLSANGSAPGGKAGNTTVNAGGSMFINSGAVANSTMLNSSGGKVGCAFVRSGGFASNTTVKGELNVEGIASGGTALNGGVIRISTGGLADGITINNSGVMLLSAGQSGVSGGKATNTTVIGGGSMFISSGAVADVTTIAYSGGYYGEAYVCSGGCASQTFVNGGWFTISAGGSADGTTINNNGMCTLSGGSVSNTTVNAGAIYVQSGARAEATNLNSSGESVGKMFVANGGKAYDAVVSGGELKVSSGGLIGGTLQIADGATVTTFAGATIDFTVSEQTAPATALVNNWGLITGGNNASYTITVNASQTEGTYSLANGTSDFNQTVTVKTTDNSTLGTLAVGETKSLGGKGYTLAKNADELTLTVGAVVVTSATRGDFGGTKGVSDILFQNLTDAANPLGAWLDADKWQWDGTLGPAAKSDWTVYGAFDFTGDGVCDIMFRSKLASTQYAVGYYDMGNGREFKTMGWGVTAEWELTDVGDFNGNGTSDILWKNTNNGYLGLWMDGTDQWVALPASALGDGQSIIGMGDVNDDGCDDILINSNGVLGAWDITGILEGTEGTPIWSSFGISVTSDWETIGCADFDGNGKADIVLWNDNGYIGTYMNCDGSDFRAIYPSAAKDEWGIPGFGDYDGDGTEDVLVRNLASGALGYWDGNDNFAWHEIGSGVDSTWAVIA